LLDIGLNLIVWTVIRTDYGIPNPKLVFVHSFQCFKHFIMLRDWWCWSQTCASRNLFAGPERDMINSSIK